MATQNLPMYQLKIEGFWREIHKSGIPKKSGIYMVYRCTYNALENTVDPKDIMYIGQAENANDRVGNHEKLPDFQKELKDGEELCYSFAEVNKKDLDVVENALVFMQKPKVNDYLKDSYTHNEASFLIQGYANCLKMTDFSITNKK